MNTALNTETPRRRKPAFPWLFLVLLVLLSGCSLPRIIVLHDPLSADDHVRLGSIYSAQSKTALARDQFRVATEADRKNEKAWQLLGDAAYELMDYREAEKAYGKAMDLDPRNGDLLNNLAWVYVRQDRKLGKAKDLVTRALDLTPEHRPYYLDTLGVVLLKRGEMQEAVAALMEAVATLPPDQPRMQAEAYLHLSEAYAAAGNAADADAALKRSQELLREAH